MRSVLTSLLLALVRRLVVASLGVGIMALSVWTLAGLTNLGPRTPLHVQALALSVYFDPFHGHPESLVAWVAAGCLLVGAVLAAAALFFSASVRDHYYQLSSGSTGSISLSRTSVRKIVNRAGEQIHGVRRLRSASRLRRQGWDVRCDTQVWADAHAHAVGGQVRDAVAESLVAHTGLPVHRVRVELAYENPEEHKAVR